MNLHTIALVQNSLAQVMQDRETAVNLFVTRLMDLDPALSGQLIEDSVEHGRLFWHVLEQWINGLSTPQTVIPVARQLGQTHARADIRPQHYHTFEQALLWTVAHMQGDTFTPAIAEAWAEAFCLLTGLVKEAAAQNSEIRKTGRL